MSAGDEMRVEKITFIPCIKPSLKTSLNSVPTGERRLSCLGQRVLPLSLPDHVSKKQTLTPGWHGSVHLPDERPLRHLQAGDICVAPLFKSGAGVGEWKRGMQWRERKKKLRGEQGQG